MERTYLGKLYPNSKISVRAFCENEEIKKIILNSIEVYPRVKKDECREKLIEYGKSSDEAEEIIDSIWINDDMFLSTENRW